jgi:hypothetical protein
MRARNQVGIGIGFSYRPARLHSLAELVPWNRILSSLKVKKFGLLADGPFITVFDQVMDVLFRDRNNEEKKDEHKRLGTTTSFINAKMSTINFKELNTSVFNFK